jgi:hypothetical protein
MADPTAPSTIERIDRALARIEAAAKRLAEGNAKLARRHHALRASIADAVATLDSLIEQGQAD